MANQTEPLTRAALIALPADGRRHELMDGVHIVTTTVSLAHQYALMNLVLALHKHVEAHALGSVWRAPADLALGEDELLKPDVFVTPQTCDTFKEWDEIHSLSLVIEITSAETSHADRHHKRLRYLRAGVPHYWVVDLELEQVEVWRPNAPHGEVWRDRVIWPVPAQAPFELKFSDILRQ